MRSFVQVSQSSALSLGNHCCSNIGRDLYFSSKIEAFPPWKLRVRSCGHASLAWAHAAPGRAHLASVLPLLQLGCSFLPPPLTAVCSCRVGWSKGLILLKASTSKEGGRELSPTISIHMPYNGFNWPCMALVGCFWNQLSLNGMSGFFYKQDLLKFGLCPMSLL